MNEKFKTRRFWQLVAAIFSIVWISFVVVFTQGQEEHWLNNTMFLLPIAVWAGVIIAFRNERDQ
ncbi:hypothetical protein RYZ26_08060 [Terasakiella sp. A23]|uniref:hypothetical protein n=1 Tax=Terasakiella sp. FCG-A23 TaxID=3080561 RepID=UPI00295399AA|nr:hypothetical protein [Terasakiella sp. A23]MDV7339542.1 hypothetical protein [Terasakiella sp. A23]